MSLFGKLFTLSFASDMIKRDASKLDPYNKNKPIFSKKTHPGLARLKRKADLIKKEKDLVKGAGLSVGLLPGLFKKPSLSSIGGLLLAGTALGVGGAISGTAVNKALGIAEKASEHISKSNSYRKYLKESGIEDTAEEKKLFGAAFMMNPRLMTNPLIANSMMKQIKDYGGLDINLLGHLDRLDAGVSRRPSIRDIATQSTIGMSGGRSMESIHRLMQSDLFDKPEMENNLG